jgi:hypothetical protein
MLVEKLYRLEPNSAHSSLQHRQFSRRFENDCVVSGSLAQQSSMIADGRFETGMEMVERLFSSKCSRICVIQTGLTGKPVEHRFDASKVFSAYLCGSPRLVMTTVCL